MKLNIQIEVAATEVTYTCSEITSLALELVKQYSLHSKLEVQEVLVIALLSIQCAKKKNSGIGITST